MTDAVVAEIGRLCRPPPAADGDADGARAFGVTAAADRIEIRLCRAKIAAVVQVGEPGQRPDLDPVVLSIEAKRRRAGNGKRLVIENGTEAEVRP